MSKNAHKPISINTILKIFAFLCWETTYSIAALTQTTSSPILVTVKPLHSMVSAIVGNLMPVELLFNGKGSAHTHEVAPSMIQRFYRAKIVIGIGPLYEAGFIKHWEKRESATLQLQNHLSLLPKRSGGFWDEHSCGCDNKNPHAHETSQVHGNSQSNPDPHFWLDPHYMIEASQVVCDFLSQHYPEQALSFKKNTAEFIKELKILQSEITDSLSKIEQKPYLVYHDGFQYWDKCFGSKGVASLTLEPGHPPHAKHVLKLKALLQDKTKAPIVVFSEPQFDSGPVQAMAKNLGLPLKVIDYIGIDIPAGPKAYSIMLHKIGEAFISAHQL